MNETTSPPARGRKAATWTQDPEGVRRDILEAARAEFVENGLSGARVDEIAARTATSKRMIYYYFGDKEGLYCAVLAQMYKRIRGFEKALDLDTLPPEEAIAKLTAFTFDHHDANPDFIRLVMVENIHHARHLAATPDIAKLNMTVIDMIEKIYARGVEAGVFRTGIPPIEIHLTISALSFYPVSNRASIREIFGYDMGGRDHIAWRRAHAVETVLRMLRP